jgi:hypothetical protein
LNHRRLRIVCYGLLFLIYFTWNDRAWTEVSPVFWTPISFFRLLPGPPRTALWIEGIQLVWKASLLACALGFATRLSSAVAALLGFFVLGLPNCFGKIHHLEGFPVLLLFLLAIGYLVGEFAWPIRLSQALFLLIFFAAGLSKLRQSGLAWLSPDNMRAILLGNLFTHDAPAALANYIARSNVLCTVCAAATIGIELSALPAIFFKRLRAPVLIGLLTLQCLIALAMGIYFTPHLVGYALFVPWERLQLRKKDAAVLRNSVHLSPMTGP